ncbi:MAG: hypothetical protein WB919_13880, partial [Candidatus Sulfotelmatobacter sp.]
RSSRNGQHENANEQKESSVQLSNYPTQAKSRLEWATRLTWITALVVQLGTAALFAAKDDSHYHDWQL